MGERPPPTVAGLHRRVASFLDAPGMDPDRLVQTVSQLLTGMEGGAVLTVYTDVPRAGHHLTRWADARGVEVVAAIDHGEGGATFALRTPPRQRAGDRSGVSPPNPHAIPGPPPRSSRPSPSSSSPSKPTAGSRVAPDEEET